MVDFGGYVHQGTDGKIAASESGVGSSVQAWSNNLDGWSATPSRIVATIQTVGVQTKTIYSYPLSINSSVFLLVYFQAVGASQTAGTSGQVQGFFSRSTGNILRLGTPIPTTLGNLTTSIDIVANTTAQTADITVTGALSTTVNWRAWIYPLF